MGSRSNMKPGRVKCPRCHYSARLSRSGVVMRHRLYAGDEVFLCDGKDWSPVRIKSDKEQPK